LKDLPGQNPAGLSITAVLERAPTADVLITKEPLRLDNLHYNAVLGTSSIRRARQLRWLRADLFIQEWRGNVQTRLRKLAEAPHVDGIVLAQAGLERLGYKLWPQTSSGGVPDPNLLGGVAEAPDDAWREFATRREMKGTGSNPLGTLEFEGRTFHVSSLSGHLLPAIGQGAIALQSRTDRNEVTETLSQIDHADTHVAIRAERALQRLLAGDCATPIGARTTLAGDQLTLRAILFREGRDEPSTAEACGSAAEPEAVAEEVFRGLQVSSGG
jgi:hydroxymethylbilane synthase